MDTQPAPKTAAAIRTRPRNLRQMAAAVLVLLTLFLAACSQDDSFSTADAVDASASSEFAETSDAEEAPLQAFDVASDGDFAEESVDVDDSSPSADSPQISGTAGGGEAAQAQLPDLGRDIIFTARLDLAATDVTAATREAIRSVESRGGFLFSQETNSGSSVLTFKVLPDQFQAVLNDLGSVGTVRSQSISADDVTAVVVDLESRINTAEASVTRLRNLLDGATELETIATLENQLLQRETTLEQLRGQLRTVRNQVDLATITVSVSELLNRPSITVETAAYAGHDAGFGCFDNEGLGTTEAGEPLTVCYRVTNTGDTPLTDLTIDDPALGATISSLLLVDGSSARIEPGESVTLAHETELTTSIRVRTSVSATGIDADGNTISDPVEATAPSLRFDVPEPEGFPSFGDVLSSSWNALVTLAILVALIAVAIAPFVAVALIVGWPVLIWYRRRRANRPVVTLPPSQPAPPAPPAPPAASGPADATGGVPPAKTEGEDLVEA